MATSPNELTIIVPAWKADFLRQALQSIADQTDQDFDCLIFDDAAPDEIRLIAAEFPKFRYHRFSENMGGKSLIAHWNRCLDLVNGEWIWVFSDDDVMSEDCVQNFRRARLVNPDSAVFQFPVDMKTSDLAQTLWASEPPLRETSAQFVAARLQGIRLSCVPDHIFHLPTLRRLAGGFVDFPLAWNSDDATWALLGNAAGIAGISGGRVFWRQSDLNISSDQGRRWDKLGADIIYLEWLSEQGFLSSIGINGARHWLATRLRGLYRFGLFDARRIYIYLPKGCRRVLLMAVIYRFRAILQAVKRRIAPKVPSTSS